MMGAPSPNPNSLLSSSQSLLQTIIAAMAYRIHRFLHQGKIYGACSFLVRPWAVPRLTEFLMPCDGLQNYPQRVDQHQVVKDLEVSSSRWELDWVLGPSRWVK